jgi:hypothetical protein
MVEIGRDSTIKKGGQQRTTDDGGGGVGGRRWWSGHRSRDEHGRDGDAGIGVGDGAIGSRMREHPRGDDERGRSGRFDGSGRREMRVIGGGEGTQGSKEGGGSEQGKEGRGKRLQWTRIVKGRTATPPTGRRSGRLRKRIRRRWSGRRMTQQLSLTVMDGATAPLRQGTARRLLVGNGRRGCSSTARDSASAAAIDRENNGDGRRWTA